ncbi:hypothetical protein MHH96_24125 [Niallia sp. FSL K6-0212]|uniref:hypothetical protein n=1 Tax=Niallia sp. FSL K6-0212 TaxID=2921423 RepID=UPI0030F9F37F
MHFFRKRIKKGVRKISFYSLFGQPLEDILDNNISDIDLFSEALLIIIETLYFSEKEYEEEYIKKFLNVFNKVREIAEPTSRCKGLCLTYLLIKNIDSLASLKDSILSNILKSWESIDIGWRKVNIGFNIIEALSTGSIEFSRELLRKIEEFRNDISFYDPHISWSYLGVLRLAIRAFNGLLTNEINSDRDMEHISTLIEMVPSNGEKAILWNELAQRLFLNGKIADSKRLVFEKIKPCINKISDSDYRYKVYVLTKVAPALFIAHKSTAFELLETMPIVERDFAYYHTAQFLFTKTPPSDPYDSSPGKGFDVNYEDVVDLCEIIEKTKLDSIIFSIIRDIADSIHQNRRFTVEQKYDIVKKLEGLINKKLPSTEDIKHEGYKIVSLAQILKIKPSVKMQEWLDLISQARKIPNKSDKVYVLTLVITNLPKSKTEKITEIIDEIDEMVETLPTISDKITQYEALANNLVKIDQVRSKGFIRKAMDLSLSKDNESNEFTLQKRLIDFAHKIDPEFAQSLVSINDKDPARQRIKHELEEEIQMLELKKRMLDINDDNSKETNVSEQYIQASWKLLAGLHSGRVGTIHVEDAREYIDVCSSLPLMEAYPIYSWLIENLNYRFKQNKNRASEYIRPIFESVLLGADLSIIMSGNNKNQINRTQNNVVSNSNSSILIKSGDREKAISYLKEWFENNAETYVKICDPFFSPDDLKILQIFRDIKPNIKFAILTSVKNQRQENIKGNYEEEYMNFWRLNISDQDPPEVDITIVGKKSDGELPIHDRWIFTKENGLRMGTSYKSLGLKKDSEISIIESNEKSLLEEDVDKYLNMAIREYDGERLIYSTFPL